MKLIISLPLLDYPSFPEVFPSNLRLRAVFLADQISGIVECRCEGVKGAAGWGIGVPSGWGRILFSGWSI
jgi:hypothetical protein